MEDTRKPKQKIARNPSSMRSKYYALFQDETPDLLPYALKPQQEKETPKDHVSTVEKMGTKRDVHEYLATLQSNFFQGEANPSERVEKYVRNVGKQLKGLKLVDVETYPAPQRFLFYLMYYELTGDGQELLNDTPTKSDAGKALSKKKPSNMPNRKLLDYVKKGSVNTNVHKMGMRFLSAYQHYEAQQSEWAAMYHDICERMADKDGQRNPEPDLDKGFKEWLSGFLFGGKDDTEGSSGEERRHVHELVVALIYEDPYVIGYRMQATVLKWRYEKLNRENSPAHLLVWMRYHMHGSELEEALRIAPEDAIYRFIGGLRYWVMLVELFHMWKTFRKQKEHEMMESAIVEDFSNLMRELRERLQNAAGALKAEFETNIFLAFGGSLILRQEKIRYQYERKILNGLMEEAKEEGERENCETISMTLTKEQIDTKAVNLLDIVVPRKSERKAGDRNKDRIKKRTMETVQVLRMLKERYGVVDEPWDSSNVRMMYDELFQYNQFRCPHPNGKKEKSYSYILSNVMKFQDEEKPSHGIGPDRYATGADRNTDGLPRDEKLMLKEKCLRGKYREKNRMPQYVELARQKLEALQSAIEMIGHLDP